MEFENSEDINCQNSALIMTNGIRKVKKGVDIFNKRILVLVRFTRTQCFRVREREPLILSFSPSGVYYTVIPHIGSVQQQETGESCIRT